jgi:hypothetical protein
MGVGPGFLVSRLGGLAVGVGVKHLGADRFSFGLVGRAWFVARLTLCIRLAEAPVRHSVKGSMRARRGGRRVGTAGGR